MGAGAPRIESLAVLPLENLMGDPKQEYFVDGMTEALIADLGQISSLGDLADLGDALQGDPSAGRTAGNRSAAQRDAVIEGSVLRVATECESPRN